MDNKTNQVFSANLNIMLDSHGKTRLQLADYCDVSRQAVDSWANGESMPRYKKLEKVCEFFGCESKDLLQQPRDYVDYIATINRDVKENALLLDANSDLAELLEHAKQLNSADVRALIAVARRMHD